METRRHGREKSCTPTWDPGFSNDGARSHRWLSYFAERPSESVALGTGLRDDERKAAVLLRHLSGVEHVTSNPEDIRADKKRPFTGAEYLESLRDGREIYIYGERVKDVT